MINAVYDIFLPYGLDSFLYHGLVAIIYVSNKFLRVQASKLLFDLAKHELFGVIVGTVRNIIQVLQTQLIHRLLALL